MNKVLKFGIETLFNPKGFSLTQTHFEQDTTKSTTKVNRYYVSCFNTDPDFGMGLRFSKRGE
jgi:hypothetical protein